MKSMLSKIILPFSRRRQVELVVVEAPDPKASKSARRIIWLPFVALAIVAGGSGAAWIAGKAGLLPGRTFIDSALNGQKSVSEAPEMHGNPQMQLGAVPQLSNTVNGSDEYGESGQDHGEDNGSASQGALDGGDSTEHGAAIVANDSLVSPFSSKSPLIRHLRKLQSVQARLAIGDDSGVSEQRKLLLALNQEIMRMKHDDANLGEILAAAIVLYSGGQPSAIEPLLKRKDLPPSVRKLLEGGILYVKGDLVGASDKLAHIDLRQFPKLLGGHLALVQARVSEGLDNRQRADLLRYTANSLPGTLLEEASLRRLIELSAVALDQSAFVKFSGRYARRFPASLYNSEFRRGFLDGVVRFESAKRSIAHAGLDSVVYSLEPNQRADILRELAEVALRKGQKNLCQYASGRERRLAQENSITWTRATLYYIACGVVEQSRESVERLQSLDVTDLQFIDRKLHASALKLARRAQLIEPFVMIEDAPPMSPQELPQDVQVIQANITNQLSNIETLIKESRQ